tara:strand:+ start:529 stop:720 length:192 start_codon:yes stop_codon:yes gene_type:complete
MEGEGNETRLCHDVGTTRKHSRVFRTTTTTTTAAIIILDFVVIVVKYCEETKLVCTSVAPSSS